MTKIKIRKRKDPYGSPSSKNSYWILAAQRGEKFPWGFLSSLASRCPDEGTFIYTSHNNRIERIDDADKN